MPDSVTMVLIICCHLSVLPRHADEKYSETVQKMKFLKWKIIAQNARNAIFGNLDFKIFRGGLPTDPIESLALRARRLC